MNMFRRLPFFILAAAITLFSVSASAEDAYLFQRMWPTLKQPWYFNNPFNIAVDQTGCVYVAERSNHRIQKYSADGRFITSWGTEGTGDGQFQYPCGVSADANGFVYVADTGNNRIQKFTSNGLFLDKIPENSTDAGQDNGTFDTPYSIKTETGGRIYVADTGNNRIQILSDNGTCIKFATKWGKADCSGGAGQGEFDSPNDLYSFGGAVYVADTDNHRIQKIAADGSFIAEWDSSEMTSPAGITVDADGYVYVADYAKHRVQKFSGDGSTLVDTWGTATGVTGLGDKEFNSPHGLASDPGGYIYVADTVNNRIQKIAANGIFAAAWGAPYMSNGILNNPYGITRDADGNIYVADKDNNRIQKFDKDGKYLDKWSIYKSGMTYVNMKQPHGIVEAGGYVYVTDYGNSKIHKFSPAGGWQKTIGPTITGTGSLNGPYGIAADATGNIYVTDENNNRVVKFTSALTYSGTQWGSYGTGNGEFNNPAGIAVDRVGNVYVADNYNNRIQKFDSSGGYSTQWGEAGSGDGQFGSPSGVWTAVDASNNVIVYVADTGNDRIQVFGSDGTFIESFSSVGSTPGLLSEPESVAVSSDGTKIYVSDTKNNRIQIFEKAEILGARAVIVAGGGPYPGNSLWDATRMCANFACRTLLFQGLPKNDIYYLSADDLVDLDGNGLADDRYGDATNENLHDVFDLDNIKNAENLVVYLVDHGGDGTFRMGEHEILSAQELAGWLDEVESHISGRIIIVYDACESGSFQDSLEGDDRIVITSTSVDEKAKFLNIGTISFSYFFWNYLFSGDDIQESFDKAADIINIAFDRQTPVISGGATGVYIGAGEVQAQSGAPYITSVSLPQYITGDAATLTAEIDEDDKNNIARVWAVIWPPDYNPGDNASRPVSDLPALELFAASAGSTHYEGTYDQFLQSGTYHVDIYAMDRLGNTSEPKLTTVQCKSRPKAIIVNGGVETDALFPAYANNGDAAYAALIAQGYSDLNTTAYNDIYYMSEAGTAHVDCVPTLQYLKDQIESLDDDDTTQNLVLYLIGSGVNLSFRIRDNETLYAEDLDGWLDDLQTNISVRVTVVYDGDSSGSFVPALTPPAGKERIVITGTCGRDAAYFGDHGETSFSTFFWGQIQNGKILYDAFVYAQNAVASLSRQKQIAFSCFRQQTPLVDASGDGDGNEQEDYDLIKNLYIGRGTLYGAAAPVIGSVAVEQQGDGSIVIRASGITADTAVQKVWANIKPIGYCPGSSETQDEQLTAVDLTETSVGSGTYEGSYMPGDDPYKVLVYAKDEDNNTSEPAETKIFTTAGADIYEQDDTFATANVIVVNHGMAQPDGSNYGLPQPHTFHALNDEDRVKFYGIAGQVYNIDLTGTGRNCLPVIELYAGDDLDTPVDATAGPPVTVVDEKVYLHNWLCPADGLYYVNIYNTSDNSTADIATKAYSVAVYYPEQPVLGEIRGMVRDSSTGNPVSSAIIRSSNDYTAMTVNGEYILPHPGGSWNLTASAGGYEPYIHSAPVSVKEGLSVKVDIFLSPVTTTVTPPDSRGPRPTTSTTTTVASTTTTTVTVTSTTTVPSGGGGSTTTTTIVSPPPDTTTSTTTTVLLPRLCPVERALGEDNVQLLGRIRQFRDRRLAKSLKGTLFTGLYYLHSPEIIEMMEAGPGLTLQVRDVIKSLMPAVEAGLAEKNISLSPAQLKKAAEMLNVLRKDASFALRLSIDMVLKQLREGSLNGGFNEDKSIVSF